MISGLNLGRLSALQMQDIERSNACGLLGGFPSEAIAPIIDDRAPAGETLAPMRSPSRRAVKEEVHRYE